MKSWIAAAVAIGAVLAAAGVAAQPAGKPQRIGVLSPGAAPPGLLEAFRDGLRELGYVEGKAMAIEWRFAGGRNETLPELARELVERHADVIVAINTQAAQAAKQASGTIPIVFVRGADPVRSGLVASLAHPDGNVTGISSISDEVSLKWLQLLMEAVPGAQRLTVIWNRGNPGTGLVAETLKRAGASIGVPIRSLSLQAPGELPGLFEAAKQWRSDALLVVDDVLITTYKEQILSLARENRLPVAASYQEFAEAGALLAFGPSVPAMYRRAAYFVDRILKGAKPADLPVEQPTLFQLVINLKSAAALGLTIPEVLLLRADQLIE